MCGRYTLATPTPAEVRSRFPIGKSVEVRRRYNAAPGDQVLAVTTDRDGRPHGELLRWGLVPSWARTPGAAASMINARVESVAERPTFRRAFEMFRCLIIADGFYEWQPAVAAGASGAGKQPFHITRTDGAQFAFAGLWSIWHRGDGDTLRSCAILTAPANSAIAPLHDRMPVILTRDAETAWLDASTPRQYLDQMLVGLSPAQTSLRKVSTAVNDARFDGPECLAAPPGPAQAALF